MVLRKGIKSINQVNSLVGDSEEVPVSIVIPTYNRKSLLSRALVSVLNQTAQPAEIIVVDDGSKDGTEQMIRDDFPNVRYCHQTNHGVSAARNKGIGLSNGSWIAFLDSDDEWKPQKLEKQITALRDSSVDKICHTNEVWIRNGKFVNQKKKHKKYGGYIYKKCLPLCRISPSAVMIHRSVFDDIGLFDESLPACEDYDLWLRICSKYPVLYLNEKLIIKHGGHSDQLSRAFWGMDRFRIKALENILNSGILSNEQAQATIKELLKKMKMYLIGARKRNKTKEVSALEAKMKYYKGRIL
ncbi:MAG TPA: glycosyltransferase family A protein [Balneolales bacterium]|nr:glycosyltransferase family A protein [Balneolales bacterium]